MFEHKLKVLFENRDDFINFGLGEIVFYGHIHYLDEGFWLDKNSNYIGIGKMPTPDAVTWIPPHRILKIEVMEIK